MPSTSNADHLFEICEALRANQQAIAEDLATRYLPWTESDVPRRTYTKASALWIFRRDGFIDRYFGSKLVFPGSLLLLGKLLPRHFPIHPTWKVSQSHAIYWELWPAVDHVVPIARGGTNDEANLISTSSLHNSAKGHWLVAELGWSIYPAGDLKSWDGLLGWFVKTTDSAPHLLDTSGLREWRRIAVALPGKTAP